MNKAELITEIASKTELTKLDSERALNAFTETVQKVLASGDKVCIYNFGTYELAERAARKGRNPSTGVEIEIAPTRAPKFKPARAFKEIVK